jgi:signal transduction histidine kinase
MVTMRERSQSAGGRFEIGSAAGGGTRVVVRIPAS